MNEKKFILLINEALHRMKIKKRSEIIAAAMYYTDCGNSELFKYNNLFNKKAGRKYKHYDNIIDSINDYKPVKKDADTIRKYILKYKLYNFDRR